MTKFSVLYGILKEIGTGDWGKLDLDKANRHFCSVDKREKQIWFIISAGFFNFNFFLKES